LIRDSYYHESSPYRLLSPQHLAQVCYDDERGIGAGTYRDAVELHWDHNKYHKTIPLDKSNIALMRSAPGFDSFMVFAAKFEQLTGEEEMICLLVAAVSDDKGESEDESDDPDDTRGERIAEQEGNRWLGQICRHPDLPDDVFPDKKQPQKEEGELLSKQQDEEWLLFLDAEEEEENDPTVHVVPKDEDTQSNSAQAQLLAWHYHLGHVPFEKIRQMAARGDLPAALRDCRVPKCAACLFGKATRRAWRSKAPTNKVKTPPVTAPGSVVACRPDGVTRPRTHCADERVHYGQEIQSDDGVCRSVQWPVVRIHPEIDHGSRDRASKGGI
jgi:hypothetical protein